MDRMRHSMRDRNLRLLTSALAAVIWLIVTGLRLVQAGTPNPNTDWFQKAGYGVFVHYLEDLQNAPDQIHSLGRRTSWDECVREFDVARFADAMAQAGAGYVMFTMHQRTRFLIAPNATFDRLTGYKPGEACATRDLVEDLYQALHRHGIPLMLYWTGDGPRAGSDGRRAAMGWSDPVPTDYVRKWAAVAQEYGERYGEKVAGWWVDGSYPFIGYDDEKLGILAAALKAGNSRRIIAFNPGVEDKVRPYSRHEDYTCGEQNQFLDQPAARWLDGEQWHILSFLGSGQSHIGAAWAMPGVKYSKQDLVDYVFEVNRAGGVVSIDVLLFRDGGLDRSQLEVLKALRPGLAAARAQAPVPAGQPRLPQTRPPAQPRRLARTGGQRRGAFPEARRGWPSPDHRAGRRANGRGPTRWTCWSRTPCAGVKVTFGKSGFATRLRVALSADRKSWQTVAAADNLEGQALRLRIRAGEGPVRARQRAQAGRSEPEGRPDGHRGARGL